jgi:2-polyprenyl-6-hydroxyphenyl methylase/3-demethylubiquinone-9 3-methyltransferase
LYDAFVSAVARDMQNGVLLDIGAGFILPVARSHGLPPTVTAIGLDISESAMRRNADIEHRVVADACLTWPLADASADLIISRSVLEHLKDTDAFARECHRVLKPGGVSIHLLPGRNAPFAVLNRLLPSAISRRLLLWAFPESKEELGFPAFYENCAFPDIRNLFERHGLIVEGIYFRYYQSTYFMVFFPAYLLSVVYDLLVWKLGIKRLSSQLLLVVRRAESG